YVKIVVWDGKLVKESYLWVEKQVVQEPILALADNGNSVSLKDDDNFIHLIAAFSWSQDGHISYGRNFKR
ncbi:hypothetical protein Tco_1300817, partial [Tanacetum coccineum]